MPPCDGLLEIMEAPGRLKNADGGGWVDDGVDVSLFLEASAMERLLDDGELFG